LSLVTGLRRSMEANHVAALSTIVASGQNKLRRAPSLGLFLGLGHTATLFAAGLIVLLLAVSIPEKVSGTLEFGVGIMLMFLGVTTLTGFNVGRFLREIVGRGEKHAHVQVHFGTEICRGSHYSHNRRRTDIRTRSSRAALPLVVVMHQALLLA
jgi:hypothetical protein